MTMLTENQACVKDSRDLTCPSTCPRRHEQLRRVLTLVDMLAPFRRFQTTQEIAQEFNERRGVHWHFRTIRRDLQFLESAGLVDCELRQDFGGYATSTHVWRLNLQRSETAQEAAIAVVDSAESDGLPMEFAGPVDADSSKWDVWMIHTEAGQAVKLWEDLSKREVHARTRIWHERRTQCVLMPWPQCLPVPAFLARTSDEMKSHDCLAAGF